MKPRLLDLFCGIGGATRGYQLAGFYVVGVDLTDQPHYIGDDFHQADALTFPIVGFDAIHASPPCQHATHASNRWRGKGTLADRQPNLIPPTRELLRASGLPWVMENVIGADMERALLLHGGMFGLGVHRPRIFESNVLLLSPQAARVGGSIGVYGERPDGRRLSNQTKQRAAKSLEEAQAAMGCPGATGSA